MSSRTTYPLRSTSSQPVLISGRFAPNGSSAPAFLAGLGFDVSRTATGEFTVVTDDPYYQLVDVAADLQLAATGTATQASLTVPGSSSPNGDVIITAASSFTGADGNAITVTFLGGATQTLAVTLVGLDITVQLGTNGSSVVTSTASAVATAINAVSGMSEVAVATHGGTGASTSATKTKTNLAGGAGVYSRAIVGPITGGKNHPFSFKIWTVDNTGTKVDISANANNQIQFSAFLNDSSVP